MLFIPCAKADQQSVKIRSVKYLTHVLSQAEKNNGKNARFSTLRLQLYIEDIYLSQGDTIYINQDALSSYIKEAALEGKSKSDMAKELLSKFQAGDFDG